MDQEFVNKDHREMGFSMPRGNNIDVYKYGPYFVPCCNNPKLIMEKSLIVKTLLLLFLFCMCRVHNAQRISQLVFKKLICNTTQSSAENHMSYTHACKPTL